MYKYLCVLLILVSGTSNAQEPVPPSQAMLKPLGITQFSPLYRRAIDVYFTAVAAYRKQDYIAAQKILQALWLETPPGDPAWKKLQNEYRSLLSVADFGAPPAYAALRMLTDCVEWRIKNSLPVTPQTTVQLTVVFVGQSTGLEPATLAELDKHEGRLTTNSLDAALNGLKGEQIVNDAYWLFDEYILAITQGRTQVKRVFVRLPALDVQVGLHRGGVELPRKVSEQILTAVPAGIAQTTDWWHLVYPSHVPKAADFVNERFVTGGMRRLSGHSSSLCFVSEDLKFLRTANQNGHRLLQETERSAALPQWLQHEFFHYLFASYPKLQLEATEHQWFDRKTWPTDFVGSIEADYYAEAMHKRLQLQTQLPLYILLSHADLARKDNWGQSKVYYSN